MDYQKVLKRLKSDNPLSESSFDSLMNLYHKCISGFAEEMFYISSIDAGLGKSVSFRTFLAAKKAEGFKDGESVLIAFRTIHEAKEFVSKDCPVDTTDVAVFTSNDEVNKLGSGRPGDARVLVTTHAMLRRKLRKKHFSRANEFFYEGEPRKLRIWDEWLTRAESIHIGMDEIASLYRPLRHSYPEWVAGLEAFVREVSDKEDGAVLSVPTKFGTGAQFRDSEKLSYLIDERQRNTVRHLDWAGGRRVRVCATSGARVLVGAGPALPSDLAPPIVLDASARVNEGYRVWKENGANVEFLPEAVRDYSNLTVSISKQGCGKTALQDAEKREPILRRIVELINSNPDEKWLVVGPKDRPAFECSKEIAGSVLKPENVSYLHWGVHYGTNEFAEVKNLIVIGGFLAPETSYLADYAAATGVTPEDLTDGHRRLMKTSKLKDNLLQAFCRGNIRRGVGDVCGEATVYLIMPHNLNPEAIVRETFPGCKVEEWGGGKTRANGQAKAVLDTLKGMIQDGRTGSVSKAKVRLAAGIGNATRFAQVLTGLADQLEALGVTVGHKHFVIGAGKVISSTPAKTEKKAA